MEVTTLKTLGEYQGKQTLYFQQTPQVLETLRRLHEFARHMTLSKNLILQLHAMLYRYHAGQGGIWKSADNQKDLFHLENNFLGFATSWGYYPKILR